MPRTSRRVAELPSIGAVIYQTAVYVRLSVENPNDDTESIENQQYMLEEYIKRKPDLQLYLVYRDYGLTGTNFDRPGFDKLMKDIKAGRVNCIVVKDA